MLRKFLPCLTMLALSVAIVQADDIRGKVKATNAEKNTITLTVDDKDQTLDVSKDAMIYTLQPGAKKKAPPTEVTVALGAIKTEAGVTVTTEKKDGKDLVTAIKIDSDLKKKKKKNQ